MVRMVYYASMQNRLKPTTICIYRPVESPIGVQFRKAATNANPADPSTHAHREAATKRPASSTHAHREAATKRPASSTHATNRSRSPSVFKFVKPQPSGQLPPHMLAQADNHYKHIGRCLNVYVPSFSHTIETTSNMLVRALALDLARI